MKTTLLIPMVPEVMGHPSLELLDKLLLSYIRNWESKSQTCYAKNDFFSKLFGETEDAISFSILKLQTLGFVEITQVPGGRCIKSKIIVSLPQTEEDTDIFKI